ncbi:LOW QUALITY PROTEIN: cytosolic carboxypeptidase 2 [Vombatus ursinus]|uniref:LOW QUALITY PROTEIN: cytosolic carboxypeptidase 2 n=1 Tax=Vombatus ursinus TaxID=29139 RepID=UPI000FFDB387|nr:LOW QUALITY PROTEIN: cytosolic carboxypeptidase 2 [Vombatus ursinus]
MYPVIATELNQNFKDPYDTFMNHHLQYYGYFRAQGDGLPNATKHQDTWERSSQYLFRGNFRKRNDLKQDTLQEEKLIWNSCASPTAGLLSCMETATTWFFKPGSSSFSQDSSHLLESPLFKSKQLLFDEFGEGNPRLREPRNLFAFFSNDGFLQAPRWPIECEVIKENIHHIEWVPPKPEYFYQPTGNEKVPEIVGEGKGTVVYQIESAPTGSYFTSSRIGGKRGLIKQLSVSLQGPDDDTLLFESRFESGNLQKAIRVDTYEYELTLRTDLYTSKHTQWFYFRVQNTRKEITYRFTIVNLLKPKSLYTTGMKPLLYSEVDARTQSIGWRRAGDEIKYYRKGAEEGQPTFYCLTWTVQFPHDQDTCYFAHFYPYTYTDLQYYLLTVANNPIQSQFCKLRTLCRSLAGNTVYLLTITNPSKNSEMAAAKKAVILSARVHPGESNGSWMMKGFLDFILGDSPDAHLLRDIFIFKVVPMLNPDGVIVGNYRCSLAGRDLNRHYKTILKESFPCIWHTRNMIKRVLEEREVLLYCDFHGHSRKNNIFLYGCNSTNRRQWLHERVFPLMLSKNAPDKFSFRSCNFKVHKCKEGTGRVVMWRMGILNSYTMESTFGGSTLGRKRDTHFNTEDLKSLGYHVCDTLLDFCDPDRTKFVQCLTELKEEISKKFSELGQEMDLDGNWSNISLSDIESSTSGSDSSLSDGLPVHLLDMAEKLEQKKKPKKKKKPLETRKQRNEVHQKNRFIQELKLTEDSQEKAEFTTMLKKQPIFFKGPEAQVKNENSKFNESKKPGFKIPDPRRQGPTSSVTSAYPWKEKMDRYQNCLLMQQDIPHHQPLLTMSAPSKRSKTPIAIKQYPPPLFVKLSQESCQKQAAFCSLIQQGKWIPSKSSSSTITPRKPLSSSNRDGKPGSWSTWVLEFKNITTKSLCWIPNVTSMFMLLGKTISLTPKIPQNPVERKRKEKKWKLPRRPRLTKTDQHSLLGKRGEICKKKTWLQISSDIQKKSQKDNEFLENL